MKAYQVVGENVLRTCCKSCHNQVDVDVAGCSETMVAARIEWAICADCQHAEVVAADERERRERDLEARRKVEESYEIRMKDSRLERYWLGFDQEHPDANLELYKWVGSRQRSSNLLTGETGLGKTRVLQDWGMFQVKRGKTVLYSPVLDLLDELSALASNPERCRALVAKIMRYDLLILDDFGKEALTESKKSRLWQIIERRSVRHEQEQMISAGKWNPTYCNRLDGHQLWISTNLTPQDVFCRFEEYGHTKSGNPLNRRLMEMCEVWGGVGSVTS